MSRSPVACPSCGTVLADRRRRSLSPRPEMRSDAIKGQPYALLVTCKVCGHEQEWHFKKVVIFDVRAA
jgi:ribosomal protein S27E